MSRLLSAGAALIAATLAVFFGRVIFQGAQRSRNANDFQGIVLCGDAGFVVSTADSSHPSTPVKWRDANAVIAYKRDLYTVDVICLGFVTANVTIEVHEEMQRWSELIDQLPSRLQGVPLFADWWERVAKPPFAPCATKLYERT